MGLLDRPREDHTHMRTDLSHLPEPKRRELETIVDLIRSAVKVEMIILYGSYARGDWKEEKDLPPQRWSGHPSDYDILVIVHDNTEATDAALGQQLQDLCNAKPLSAHVRPIVHKLQHVNDNLREARYFFVDIKREGRLLYDRGLYDLAEPAELSPKHRQRIAQEYFDVWFRSAKSFYKRYTEAATDDDDLRNAVFQLNQTAEAAYKTILLVFTHYSPHEHLLSTLGRLAAYHGPVFEEIFPLETEDQQEYFRRLDAAYIGARYHLDFEITREDLDYLAPRVRKLLEVTEEICRAKIERLGES